MELLGGEEHKQSTGLDWRMDDDVGLCLGFLAGDESAERERRREREKENEKEKEKERKSADV